MASSALDLLFKLKASDEASSVVKRMRASVASDVKGIETSGVGSFNKLGDSADTSASKMAGFSRTLPLIGAAITAVAGAAVAGTLAIFNLAKQTSDFGSEIFDASQKTGLNTEALSALKFAADQSNGSMAELSAGIKIFSKTVGDAARGSDEAKDKLRRLGIDPKAAILDLQGALNKAFQTINQAPEGIRQTNAALDAFGRSGANLIPTIKSFDGDLASLIIKAKALGVTLTEEDAKAADQFGDTLDTISAQAKGVAYTFARQFMPDITNAMNSVSQSVKDNKEAFKAWGEVVGDTIRGVRRIAESELAQVLLKLASIAAFVPMVINRGAAGERPITDTSASNPFDPRNRMKAGQQAATDQGAYDIEANAKAEEEARKEAEQAEKEASDARLLRMKTYTDKLRRLYEERIAMAKENLEKGVLDQESYVAALISAEEFLLKGLKLAIRAEIEELNFQEKNLEQRSARKAALLEKDIAITAARDRRVVEIRKTGAAAAIELNLLQRRRQEEINQLYDDRDTERIEKNMRDENVLQSEGLQALLDIQTDAISRRIELLRFELSQHETTSTRQKEILHELAVLETQRAIAIEQATQRINDARTRELPPGVTGPGTPGPTAEGEPLVPIEQLGVPPEFPGQWEQLAQSISDSIGQSGSVVQTVGGMIASTFQNIGQAVGAAVRSFVLFGTAGGSLRKFAAEVIASVAQMAAVQAVFELAQGLARLALFLFFGDPKALLAAKTHFAAAAMFAGIAGVAALAGRAVAGNSFQQQGAAGGTAGGGSGGGSQGTSGTEETRVIEQNRNQQPQRIDLHVHSNDSHIVKVLTQDFRNNGDTRGMMLKVVEG